MRLTSRVVVASVVLLSALLVGATLPAAAQSVSTSDGVTLNFTSTGSFSSMTVNGNTVPTLSGVTGGFFIVPMDGVVIDATRHTYYPGTQITGTATQSGSNVIITGTAQNQTFSITLTGGLPYIKVDGTVTGNGTDHTFLVDFRLPVNANNWTWANRVNSVQTISTSSNSNWYFANIGFHWQWHPQLTENPYGSITAYNVSGVSNMGLSLTPLFYPPSAYVIEYNAQTGFFIEFELGTTSKTTAHPNTADFHFTLYQHTPKWGNRSAVQRFQSFFPDWFNRVTTGGNWFVDCAHANYPPTTTDFRMKYAEGTSWDDSTTEADGILTMRYTEPWCWHEWSETPSAVWAETFDIAANWTYAEPPCHCPGNRGMTNVECAQATFNSVDMNPDGTLIGPDNPSLWTDYGSSWRWIMDPDPAVSNWELFTPGTTRSGNDEFREWYYSWGTAPSSSANIFKGLYYDSVGGYWGGWDVVHNFNPNEWPTYAYSPGIYWGSIGSNNVNYGNGLVTMWAPMSNVQWMKYSYPEMRKEGRIVMGNMGPSYECFLAAPFMDMWGIEAGASATAITDMAMERAIAGPKPVSFLYGHTDTSGNECVANTADMLATLPFGIYPGMSNNPDYTKNQSELDTARPIYQQFMPIFDDLDAAGWNPITAAVTADTTQTLERFGPDSTGAIYFVLQAVNAGTGTVTVYSSDLGWSSSPTVTVTALYGTAPSTSFDGNGNLVMSFGSIAAADDRVVKLVYSGTPTVPVAAFTANATTVSVNTAVNFTDQSTHSPTTWYWDFGDGCTSLSQNPSHTYTAGGSNGAQYIVSLTASNASGQSTCTKDKYITVTAAPVASFSWYRTRGVIGAETTAEFHDRSTNSPTSWSWTFGDGGTSTLQNPTHTYTATGTYTVALKATNAAGNNTSTQTSLVTMIPINAGFTATPTFGSAPLSVTFTDCSTGTPTSWSWGFGDGASSTVQNPTHSYAGAGYYSPCLTVKNGSGQSTTTWPDYITVCTTAVVYPTSYTMDVPTGGTQHLVSGSLSNLQAQDGTCMVFQGDSTSGGKYYCETNFAVTSGYTQSQIAGGLLSVTMDTSDANDTCMKNGWMCPTNTCPVHPLASTLTNYQYSVPASTAIDSTGVTSTTICCFPQSNLAPITISYDLVQWTLYLVTRNFQAISATLDSGTNNSGSYLNTQGADASYWVVTAVKSGSDYQDQETYTFNTGMSSLSAVTISVKGKVNTGTQTEKIYLYNNSTSAWDLEKTVTLNTTNTLSTQAVSSASNYISGGTVKVRVFVGGTKTSSYTHSTDYVSIACTP